MHLADLPFSCPINERLFDTIIRRSAWKGQDPKYTLDWFRKGGAQYMDVSENDGGYTVSFGKAHIFPLLTAEEEEQMIFILSLEN